MSAGIIEINGEEYVQVISDGVKGTKGMRDFMTRDKSIRILAFPEGGGDWFNENDEEQSWEITLMIKDSSYMNGYYEYTIDGLYTTEQFDIIKKDFVVDKALKIPSDSSKRIGPDYEKKLNRELKTMLLTEGNMDFKKEYDYMMSNEVDVNIYDKLRELIKEFGGETPGTYYISDRNVDERKFHINNQKNVNEELRISEYIKDEIYHDLLGAIKKRKAKLYRISEYTRKHIILDDVIYFQDLERGGDIWFATEDRSVGVSAHVTHYSIETKEPFFKVLLRKESETSKYSSDIINIGTNYTRLDVDKIIKYYVIDKKMTFNKVDYETKEGKRDLTLEILLNVLDGKI